MKNQKKYDTEIKVLRLFRKIHKITGLILFIVIIIIATTGILLGLKKNSAELILKETKTGLSNQPNEWLSVESLILKANEHLIETLPFEISLELDRIDFRPHKGVAKFIYKKHFWSVQIDCTTGKVLSLEKRYSDLIENIHDGSIIDKLLNNKQDIFKIIYTSITGFSLILFCITGFWLWYGPKRLRQKKAN